MLWKHIADSVNAIGGNGRSVGQVKKRWKDMKAAVIDRQRQSTKTGGGWKVRAKFQAAATSVQDRCVLSSITNNIVKTYCVTYAIRIISLN